MIKINPSLMHNNNNNNLFKKNLKNPIYFLKLLENLKNIIIIKMNLKKLFFHLIMKTNY